MIIDNGEVNLSTEGIEEFRMQANQAKNLFTSRPQSITSWKVDLEKITVIIEYSGIMANDLPNGMNAGDDMSLNGKSEFYFK